MQRGRKKLHCSTGDLLQWANLWSAKYRSCSFRGHESEFQRGYLLFWQLESWAYFPNLFVLIHCMKTILRSSEATQVKWHLCNCYTDLRHCMLLQSPLAQRKNGKMRADEWTHTSKTSETALRNGIWVEDRLLITGCIKWLWSWRF